jgi:hypothetical protein
MAKTIGLTVDKMEKETQAAVKKAKEAKKEAKK